MDIICQPLLVAMRRSWLEFAFRLSLILVGVGILICLVLKLDFIGTYASAMSRILLLKFLPLWNWQPLYFENCVINNPFYYDNPVATEDCMVRTRENQSNEKKYFNNLIVPKK